VAFKVIEHPLMRFTIMRWPMAKGLVTLLFCLK